MNTATATFSEYRTLPLSLIDESTTNPRRTFETTKLVELAQSISVSGLIQPITVRPKADRFEIIAGARRYRAAQIAELAEVPTRVLELTDEQTLEVQIIENSQREDVHPYEEASGYQRLLELPGYDVAALASKCSKSQSHVYTRLTLLALIPEVAGAFQKDEITASHANLLQGSQQTSRPRHSPMRSVRIGTTTSGIYSRPKTSPRGFRAIFSLLSLRLRSARTLRPCTHRQELV